MTNFAKWLCTFRQIRIVAEKRFMGEFTLNSYRNEQIDGVMV